VGDKQTNKQTLPKFSLCFRRSLLSCSVRSFFWSPFNVNIWVVWAKFRALTSSMCLLCSLFSVFWKKTNIQLLCMNRYRCVHLCPPIHLPSHQIYNEFRTIPWKDTSLQSCNLTGDDISTCLLLVKLVNKYCHCYFNNWSTVVLFTSLKLHILMHINNSVFMWT